MSPEEDTHDPPRGGDLSLSQLIGDLSVVVTKVFEGSAGEFVATSEIHEAVHRKTVLALDVLEHDQAALLVFHEQFRPDGEFTESDGKGLRRDRICKNSLPYIRRRLPKTAAYHLAGDLGTPKVVKILGLILLLGTGLFVLEGMKAETVEETIPAPTIDRLCIAD